MNRILTSAVAGAAVIGVAAAAPTQASANPVIIAPALLALALGGAVVGGAVVGSAVTNAQHPQGRVLVTSDVGPASAEAAPAQVGEAAPPPSCRPDRAKVHGVWHNIQICD
jgi:hypothetical protein